MNYKSSSLYPWVGPWDAEGGGAKSVAEALSEAGHTIATAYDLYTHLKQHHSSPTNYYHESVHQIDFREFLLFSRGTFLTYHHCQPKALDGVRPFYCWAVKRNNNTDAKLSASANIFALVLIAQKVHSINTIILTSWASGLWRK